MSSAPSLDVAGEAFDLKLTFEPFPRRGCKRIAVKVADIQGRIPARLQGGDRKHLFVMEERLRRMGKHLHVFTT